MSLPPGSAWSKPPVDDADNIQKFLDAMVRKNLAAFTNSKPISTKAKEEDEQSTSSTVDPILEPSGSQAMNWDSPGNPNYKSVADVTMQDAETDPSAGRENAGPSTPMSPLSPTEPDDLNTPQRTVTTRASPKQTATATNTAQPITNKTLTSPLSGGVRAPPSTPDAPPTGTVQQIISDAFGDLKVGSPPTIALGFSRHAPPHMAMKDRSQENTRPSGADDMPRFFSPAKLLSPEEKQQRDESFRRILALTSPNLPNLKENKTVLATTPPGKYEDRSGILESRWAENRQGTLERRISGSAAIPIVDPKSKAHTSPVSSAAAPSPSQKMHFNKPAVLSAAPFSPSRKFTVNSSPASSAGSSLPSPSVSGPEKAQTTRQSTPAARSLSITATLTVTSPPTSLKTRSPRSLSPDRDPGIKPESSVPSVTSWGPRLAEPQSSNSDFKVFDNKPNVNEANLFFSSWPKLTERDAARTQPPISSALRKRLADLHILAARVRRVTIVKLPPDSSAKFVQSLVFGGPLELLTVGSSSASVVFQHAEDCVKYYDATSNGLVYKGPDGKEEVCFVELAKEVDVVGGLLRGYIEKGFTRCVRAIGVDEDWSMPALLKMAGRKGRTVEHVIDGVNAAGVSDLRFYLHPYCFGLSG